MTSKPPAADRVLAELADRIIGGTYQPGTMLPSETELGASLGVSRLTIREAVKILRAQRVVEVKHGRGTLVNPVALWSPLDATLLAAKSRHTIGASGMSKKLLEARRLVEIGVAELAAARRTEEDLQGLFAIHERMQAVLGDLDAVTTADLEFHRALMAAAGNAFISALFDPLEELLYETRRQSKAFPEMCEHAIAAHWRILRAVRDRDPEGARRAMHDHLVQTEEDLESLLVDDGPAVGQAEPVRALSTVDERS